MAWMLNGVIKVGIFPKTLKNQKTNCYLFIEDPYYGSGSGSGFDEDDEEIGSGQEPVTITSIAPDVSPITTVGEVIRGMDFTETPKIDITSTQLSIKPTSSETHPSTGGGATSTRLPEMSKLKAFAVYMVPIFVAWFGGLFSELL